MKTRDALSDIWRNKTEIPKIDSSEKKNLYVTWKQPNTIGERIYCSTNGDENFQLVKIEISSWYIYHTSKNSNCDKELNVENNKELEE